MSSASAGHYKAEHRARADQAALETVAQRLTIQFPDLPSEMIQRAVHGEYDDHDNSAGRDFAPILLSAVRAELVRRRA